MAPYKHHGFEGNGISVLDLLLNFSSSLITFIIVAGSLDLRTTSAKYFSLGVFVKELKA
jgi:hypothetical protein